MRSAVACASGISAVMPALLTSTSIRPHRSAAAAATVSAACGARTSMASGTTPGCCRAVSSSACARRPTPSTCAPCSANASAVARPMPDPAPVTMTTRSVKERSVDGMTMSAPCGVLMSRRAHALGTGMRAARLAQAVGRAASQSA
jgi:hypothetical protein